MQEIIKKLEKHDKIFEQIDRRFEKIKGKLDFIAIKVAEHDERFDKIDEKLENVATKEDISRITDTLDRFVKLYETKEQETTLLAHGLREVEEQTKNNTKDIQVLKTAVGIS